MRAKSALFALCFMLVAPAFAQGAPAPQPAAPEFSGMFTPWSGVSRDSLRAETAPRAPASPTGAVPASTAARRTQGEAVALGERVAEAVRAGDCAEGERMARAAGDFPLVAAVRDYCRTGAPR